MVRKFDLISNKLFYARIPRTVHKSFHRGRDSRWFIVFGWFFYLFHFRKQSDRVALVTPVAPVAAAALPRWFYFFLSFLHLFYFIFFNRFFYNEPLLRARRAWCNTGSCWLHHQQLHTPRMYSEPQRRMIFIHILFIYYYVYVIIMPDNGLRSTLQRTAVPPTTAADNDNFISFCKI